MRSQNRPSFSGFKVLLKELQSLGLDVKLLRDDGTEVEVQENVDYNERDLRSVIEGDREPRQQESFGAHGYQEQEFAGGELVDVDPEEELLESLEGLEDSEAEADDFDEE